ncbi:MAG: hypothetical protein WBB01_10020 [Phormidesmis sp.]
MTIKPHLNILIGGAPRTGKSLLAASLFDTLHVPVIHGDTLVNAMKNGYPGSFGVQFDTLPPEDHAARMEPVQLFLKKAIRNMGKDISYRAKVFESCYLHPRTVAMLASEGAAISVFLLYGDFDVERRLKDVQAYAENNQHCWSHGYDEMSLRRSLIELKQFSQFLRLECEQYGVNWVEIENDWTTEWTKIRDALIDRVKVKLKQPERPSPFRGLSSLSTLSCPENQYHDR